MAKEKTNWEEINVIVISTIILGFVFGFNDKTEVFSAATWTQNYVQQAILSLLFILLFIRITQAYSKRHGITTIFSLWSLKQFWFSAKTKIKGKGIPIGIILPLFVSVMTFGKVFFASTLTPQFTHTTTSRFGKKYTRPTEAELASIAMMGPLILTLFGIFFSALKDTGLNNISIIPFAIAISTMIPLPGLNGITVFAGSPVRYVLVMLFIIMALALTYVTTPLQSVILGVIASGIITFFHYVYSYIFK